MSLYQSNIKSVLPGFPLLLLTLTCTSRGLYHWHWLVWNKREKGRDLTQSYDKSPYTSRNVNMAKGQHKQRHKKFDYTAVASVGVTLAIQLVRLTGLWPNCPTPTTTLVSKGHRTSFKICWKNCGKLPRFLLLVEKQRVLLHAKYLQSAMPDKDLYWTTWKFI